MCLCVIDRVVLYDVLLCWVLFCVCECVWFVCDLACVFFLWLFLCGVSVLRLV